MAPNTGGLFFLDLIILAGIVFYRTLPDYLPLNRETAPVATGTWRVFYLKPKSRIFKRMTEKESTLYFIGAGPGAPGCLTLDGKEALQKCLVVYTLHPFPETFAEFLSGKEVRGPLEYGFEELIRDVHGALEQGDAGFLVPGDMTIFSPFLPVLEYFSSRSRVIPGVGTMNAAAAVLKTSLDMPGISHSVVMTSPKRFDGEGGRERFCRLAEGADTLVLFMNNRPLDQLSQELSCRFPPETPVAIVSRIGLEGEKVYRGTLSTIADRVGRDDIFGLESGDPSLALMIVGDVLESRSDPVFWDRRKNRLEERKKRKGKAGALTG